jgi:predicted lipid-binding transport protein (Tim44 family)
MYRRGSFWGGGYRRRRGFPLFPMGMYGMGMGMGGGGLIGDLMAGGIGYMMGKQSAQQAPQYQPQQAPQYQPPQYQPQQAPQYQPPQTPQYQPPQYQPQQVPQYQPPSQYQASGVAPNQQGTAASGTNDRLAQLRLLGHLRDSGMLTNDEFEVEKQKIMQGS